MLEVTIVLAMYRVEVHDGKLEGARDTSYYHPLVTFYQIGTFKGSSVTRSQLNYALCAWLRDNEMPVSKLVDGGAR